MAEGPLSGIRVLDLTDERAIYGAKLLADLGADVVRPEPPEGDPLRGRGPHWEKAEPGATSLWHAFFASNRRFYTLTDGKEQEELQRLAENADILLTCRSTSVTELLAGIEAANPNLLIINTSSFGPEGPWADFQAPDLVAGALAGAVATTGDVDTPPLKCFGELNFMVSGVYVAIAAIAGWLEREESGQGQVAEISVHECIASCLEQVLMFYWYSDVLMRPEGKVLARRGSTHWTDAFTVMNGKNGSIMITPAPDFDRQLAWLIEEGVHGDLIDPKYQEPEHLRERVELTMKILTEWVSGKDVEALFYEAQERHAPYGWVQPIERLAENAQLQARNWFVETDVGGASLPLPGAPYHFSDTPWTMGDYKSPGADTDAILADIGWGGVDE